MTELSGWHRWKYNIDIDIHIEMSTYNENSDITSNRCIPVTIRRSLSNQNAVKYEVSKAKLYSL